ncbi:MAG TPA: flagellar export chaperone FliS [Burkholderiales bacterium]|nr:flagellar export chaperone FliS [Burkholderiales bacterium]
MATQAELGAYRSASLDASIAGASPHQLIAMLFQGARTALARARAAMLQKNVAARGEAISKALAIIDDGLKASLDSEKGGDLAEKLHALYDYMIRQLTIAGLENNVAKVEEVDGLLAGIEDAWRQIGSVRPLADNGASSHLKGRPSISYGKV